MKTRILSVLAALCAFSLAGCGTPTQQIAMAGAAAGNVYATYELSKGGSSAVKALTDLAADLPNIPLGKVSPAQLGALNAELQVAKAALVTDPEKSSQIASLISLVSNNAGAATGGALTAQQAIVFAQFQNVALGITNAIQFYTGQQSVLHPSG